MRSEPEVRNCRASFREFSCPSAEYVQLLVLEVRTEICFAVIVGLMCDLASYYCSLANWEGKEAVSLVAPWDSGDAANVSADFQQAFESRGFSCLPLTIVAGTSNQSIGNKVAEFLVDNINAHL